MLLYVDDIIVTYSSQPHIKALIDKLNNQFALKQLENLEYFLGIEVKQQLDGSLFLSQAKYLRDLLKPICQKQRSKRTANSYNLKLETLMAWLLTISVIQFSIGP